MSDLPAGMPPHHRAVVERFVAACRADARVVAAFLSGSYAKGTADAWSDLDLDLITTDAAYDEFLAGREAFMRRLGEPLFLESFSLPNFVFFVYADGTEGELALAPASRLDQLHGGPHRVLLDKTGILAGVAFPWQTADPDEQRETLRRLITWFWHDLSHCVTALARGQLWWAHGQLEELRRVCVDLARLRQDFSGEAGGYEKLELAVPVAQLAPLRATFCPLESAAILQAVQVIVRYYQELARPLAQTHGVPYPEALERVMIERLAKLGDGHAS
jgi:predicted nucleotidyltransferase